MELKSIFKMVKTNRYTQDGRDEIAKLQAEEVEDVKYKTGDISQKTGLQKQPDGSWAPPKGGNKGINSNGVIAQQRMKREDEHIAQARKDAEHRYQQKLGDDTEQMAEEYVNKTPPEQIEKYIKALRTPFSREHDSFNDPERLAKALSNALAKKKETESKPAAMPKLTERADKYVFNDLDNMSDEDKVFKALNAELDEAFGDRDGYPGNVETWANDWLDHAMYEGGIGFKKSHASNEPDAAISGDDVMRIVEENPERWSRIIGNAKKFYSGKGTSTNFESDEAYPIKLLGGKTVKGSEWTKGRSKRDYPLTGRDSAPRELTGDCKIKIRPETQDKVYQIGEISQKTGLQKTANGWRPPQETKFGKVKQNKEGQWGVQVKQGKGSDFLKHKSEAEAKRALSNYTAGYNTTERSKEDPHSDKARQAKQWRKEDEKAVKARRAEGRAAHAAQFQKKGSNIPAGVPSFSGMESGDYDNKLRAEGWETSGWEGNAMHSSAIFKKGDRTIRVVEGQPGKISHVEEIKPKTEATPQQKTWANNMLDKFRNDRIEDYIKTLRTPGSAEGQKYDNPEQYAAVLEKAYKQKKEKNAGWMKKINSEYGDVINKNPKLKDWIENGRAPRLVVPGEGTYIGEAASERFMDLSRENRNKIQSEKKPFKYETMEIGEGEARDLILPYLEQDAAPRELTGDTRIRVKK